MDINATLLVQLIVFAILVWFTLKYVWPMMANVLSQREKKIAEGLEAAERAKRDLKAAQDKIETMIKEAKTEAAHIIEQASRRGTHMLEEARDAAKEESKRTLIQAQEEIIREVDQAREALRHQLASLAVAGASKIIRRNLDEKVHADLLDEFVAEI